MYRRALVLTSRSSVDEISHPTFTFYDRRVERSSLPRQHVVLYLLFPPTPHARVEQAGRIQAESTFYIYIRGGSAYFVYPLFIVGSLLLFFCYVLPAPGLLATRRLPSLLLFPSFPFSPPFPPVAEAYLPT